MKTLTCSAALLAVLSAATTPGGAQAAQTPANAAGQVMTVTGPMPPDHLGRTLMHEHIFIDFTIPDDDMDRWVAAGRPRPATATATRLYHAPLTLDILASVMLGAMNRDNWVLNDEAQQTGEVAEFKRVGGGTIVDLTGDGLGRDPEALRRVAQGSGLNIVMGSGGYRPGWYPKDVEQRTVESLTDAIVHDITVGVGTTGIRAGIIGEVSTGEHPDAGMENRVLRASAHASRLTGAAIAVHVEGAARQHARILDIVASEGADPTRVIFGHADFLADDMAYLTPLLDRGATLEFDLLGRPPVVTRPWPIDSRVAKTIVDLIKAGYGNRLLLSRDVRAKTDIRAFGGTGYSYIEQQFLPYLKRQGVTDAQITQMVVENPRRLLTLAAPRAPENR